MDKNLEKEVAELNERMRKASKEAQLETWAAGIPFIFGPSDDDKLYLAYPDGKITEVVYDGKGNLIKETKIDKVKTAELHSLLGLLEEDGRLSRP